MPDLRRAGVTSRWDKRQDGRDSQQRADLDHLGISSATLELRPRRAPRLSKRQREVVSCLALGLTIEEVGRHLGIARGTAAQHRTVAARAIGVRTVVELSHYAIVQGWVDAGDALSIDLTEAALRKIALDTNEL